MIEVGGRRDSGPKWGDQGRGQIDPPWPCRSPLDGDQWSGGGREEGGGSRGRNREREREKEKRRRKVEENE